MFDGMTATQQYWVLAGATFLAVILGWILYNRREKRRERADEIGDLMLQWELLWIKDLFRKYSRGDYSGIYAKGKEVVEALRTDVAIVDRLFACTCKVAAWCVENAPDKAAKLREILAEKTAKK